MTWTADEWDAFCGLLEGWWPGEFSENAAEAWRLALEPVHPTAAMIGLRRLLNEGRRFRPSASELLTAIRNDPSRPTFDEALILMRRAFTADCPDGAYADFSAMRNARFRAIMARLAGHPLVAAFVQRQGLERLLLLEIDDPDWGAKRRADLQAAWNVHVETFDGREIAALASGSGELKQLDPLSHLPRPELSA